MGKVNKKIDVSQSPKLQKVEEDKEETNSVNHDEEEEKAEIYETPRGDAEDTITDSKVSESVSEQKDESASTPVIEIVDDKEEKSDEEDEEEVIVPSDHSLDSEAEVEFVNADPYEEDTHATVDTDEKTEVVNRDVTETEEESPSTTQITDKDVSTTK